LSYDVGRHGYGGMKNPAERNRRGQAGDFMDDGNEAPPEQAAVLMVPKPLERLVVGRARWRCQTAEQLRLSASCLPCDCYSSAITRHPQHIPHSLAK
jgi:hypothetical protein